MDLGRLLDGVLRSDLSKEVKKVAGGGSGGGGMGGIAGGAAAGSLMALLLGNKTGRKMGGKALKYGGAALLAGLAYKAWSDYRDKKPPQHESLDEVPQAPSSGAFALDRASAEGTDFRLAVIRAMIAAAKCDGHIDAEEHGRVHAAIEAQGLSAEEKGLLFDAFAGDADPVAIARLASGEEQAAELYAASRMAIDPDVEAERRYLDRLAGALALPQALVDHLDVKIEDARQQLASRSA